MNSKETATHRQKGQIPDIPNCLLKLLQALNSVSLSVLLRSKNPKQREKHTLDFDLLHCFLCAVVDGDSDWNELTMVVYLEGMQRSEIQSVDCFQALSPSSSLRLHLTEATEVKVTLPSMTSNVFGNRVSATPSSSHWQKLL